MFAGRQRNQRDVDERPALEIERLLTHDLPEKLEPSRLFVLIQIAQIMVMHGERGILGNDLQGKLHPRQTVKCGSQDLVPADEVPHGFVQDCFIEIAADQDGPMSIKGSALIRLLEEPYAPLLR
jgi:hypothetical protein